MWSKSLRETSEKQFGPPMIPWSRIYGLALFLALIHCDGNLAIARSVEVGTRLGYGRDHLDWNIRGLNGNPNVLSELTFTNIQSGVGILEGRWREERWSLEGELGYGLVSAGNVRDDDFDGNNRSGLFSRSQSSIDGHDLQSAALTAGVVLVEKENATLRIMLGTRYYSQRFRITNGQQIVSSPSNCPPVCPQITPPPPGPINNLNSSYAARWFGPTVGLAGTAQLPTTPLWFRISAIWLPWLNYSGEGRFNLRSDLQQDPSFSHSATGSGAMTDLALAYPFLERYEVSGGWRYMYFSASNGTATTNFRTGSPTVTNFNEVHTRSNLFYIGLAARLW
jgi:Protochlamydia outer membrane protein